MNDIRNTDTREMWGKGNRQLRQNYSFESNYSSLNGSLTSLQNFGINPNNSSSIDSDVLQPTPITAKRTAETSGGFKTRTYNLTKHGRDSPTAQLSSGNDPSAYTPLHSEQPPQKAHQKYRISPRPDRRNVVAQSSTDDASAVVRPPLSASGSISCASSGDSVSPRKSPSASSPRPKHRVHPNNASSSSVRSSLQRLISADQLNGVHPEVLFLHEDEMKVNDDFEILTKHEYSSLMSKVLESHVEEASSLTGDEVGELNDFSHGRQQDDRDEVITTLHDVENAFPNDDLELYEVNDAKPETSHQHGDRRMSAPSALIIKPLKQQRRNSAIKYMIPQSIQMRGISDGCARENRKHKKNGAVRMFPFDADKAKLKERYFFLLTDLLLIGKRRKEGVYNLKAKLLLSDLWVNQQCAQKLSEDRRDICFAIGWPECGTSVVICSNTKERNEWVDVLERQVQKMQIGESLKDVRVQCDEISSIKSIRIEVRSEETVNDCITNLLSATRCSDQKPDSYLLLITHSGGTRVLKLYESPYLLIRHYVNLSKVENEDTSALNASSTFDVFLQIRTLSAYNMEVAAAAVATTPSSKFHSIPAFRRKKKEKKESPSSSGRLYGHSLEEIWPDGAVCSRIMTLLGELAVRGAHTKGIFRVSHKDKVEVRNYIDQPLYEDDVDCDLSSFSPLGLAGALKEFLRSVPNSVLDYQLINQWVEIVDIAPVANQLRAIKSLLRGLPIQNQNLVKHVLVTVSEIAQRSDENQMNEENLAKMLSTNLLVGQGVVNSQELAVISKVTAITKLMIEHVATIYTADVCAECAARIRDCAKRATSSIDTGLSSDNEVRTPDTIDEGATSGDSLDTGQLVGGAEDEPRSGRPGSGPVLPPDPDATGEGDGAVRHRADPPISPATISRDSGIQSDRHSSCTNSVHSTSALFSPLVNSSSTKKRKAPAPPTTPRSSTPQPTQSMTSTEPKIIAAASSICHAVRPTYLPIARLSRRLSFSTESLSAVDINEHKKKSAFGERLFRESCRRASHASSMVSTNAAVEVAPAVIRRAPTAPEAGAALATAASVTQARSTNFIVARPVPPQAASSPRRFDGPNQPLKQSMSMSSTSGVSPRPPPDGQCKPSRRPAQVLHPDTDSSDVVYNYRGRRLRRSNAFIVSSSSDVFRSVDSVDDEEQPHKQPRRNSEQPMMVAVAQPVVRTSAVQRHHSDVIGGTRHPPRPPTSRKPHSALPKPLANLFSKHVHETLV